MNVADMKDVEARVNASNLLFCFLHWETDFPLGLKPKGISDAELASLIEHEVRKVMRFGQRVVEVATPITTLSTTYFDGPCGIYFLVSGDEIAYVGQSKYIKSRVSTHAIEKAGKFDRVAFIEVDCALLDSVESRFIQIFNPRLNSNNLPKSTLREMIEYAESVADLPPWLTGDALIPLERMTA